jgi:branched-chain amino acid transport system ATP-binding protein
VAILEVRGLGRRFGGLPAVDDVDLDVEAGEVFAIIGPNGAGKSTLFKLITGHLKPDRGRIKFKDEDIGGLPPYQICRKGISLSFQIVNIFSRMTVFENVQVAVLSHQKRTFNLFSPARRLAVKQTNEILQNVGLSQLSNRVCGALSHGDQKVLEIAIAMGNDPELLILDEPTAGMSPDETANTINLINRLTKDMGLTILFCEHDMELVFSIADKIMCMQQGVSLIQGKPDEVRCNRLVQEA